MARAKLGFSIDEWLALPWWQRRVYLEGMADEAAQYEAIRNGKAPDSVGGGSDPLEALYGGTLDDVKAAGFAVEE